MMKVAIILCIYLNLIYSAKIPPNFQKCQLKQPDFKKCVFDAANNALPQLKKPYKKQNLPTLDPLELPQVKIEHAAVNQVFANSKIYGLTDAKFEKFEFNFSNKTVAVSGIIPAVRLEGEYQFDGKIFSVGFNGKGKRSTILKSLKFNGTLEFDEYQKKSKTFMRFTKSEINVEPESIVFNHENLSENQKTNEELHNMLNKDWKTIWDNNKLEYVQIINQIFLVIANGFFSRVSLQEAFDY